MPVSKAGKLFFILIPLIIYECILYAGESVIMVAWLMPRLQTYYIAETQTVDQLRMLQDLTEFAVSNGLLMQVVLSIPSILICLYLIRRDYPRRRFYFDSSEISPYSWGLLIPLAAAWSLAGNCFLNIGNIAAGSENFEAASEILNAGPLFIQILGAGILLPVCEELVMRGLVYMRMRQYLHVNTAIILSALLFAFIHGNMIQGIYAFVLGVILAWFYEKYGSILAPLTIHIAANLSAMACAALLDRFLPESGGDVLLAAAGTVFAVLAAVLTIVLNRNVCANRIYPDSV